MLRRLRRMDRCMVLLAVAIVAAVLPNSPSRASGIPLPDYVIDGSAVIFASTAPGGGGPIHTSRSQMEPGQGFTPVLNASHPNHWLHGFEVTIHYPDGNTDTCEPYSMESTPPQTVFSSVGCLPIYEYVGPTRLVFEIPISETGAIEDAVTIERVVFLSGVDDHLDAGATFASGSMAELGGTATLTFDITSGDLVPVSVVEASWGGHELDCEDTLVNPGPTAVTCTVEVDQHLDPAAEAAVRLTDGLRSRDVVVPVTGLTHLTTFEMGVAWHDLRVESPLVATADDETGMTADYENTGNLELFYVAIHQGGHCVGTQDPETLRYSPLVPGETRSMTCVGRPLDSTALVVNFRDFGGDHYEWENHWLPDDPTLHRRTTTGPDWSHLVTNVGVDVAFDGFVPPPAEQPATGDELATGFSFATQEAGLLEWEVGVHTAGGEVRRLAGDEGVELGGEGASVPLPVDWQVAQTDDLRTLVLDYTITEVPGVEEAALTRSLSFGTGLAQDAVVHPGLSIAIQAPEQVLEEATASVEVVLVNTGDTTFATVTGSLGTDLCDDISVTDLAPDEQARVTCDFVMPSEAVTLAADLTTTYALASGEKTFEPEDQPTATIAAVGRPVFALDSWQVTPSVVSPGDLVDVEVTVSRTTGYAEDVSVRVGPDDACEQDVDLDEGAAVVTCDLEVPASGAFDVAVDYRDFAGGTGAAPLGTIGPDVVVTGTTTLTPSRFVVGERRDASYKATVGLVGQAALRDVVLDLDIPGDLACPATVDGVPAGAGPFDLAGREAPLTVEADCDLGLKDPGAIGATLRARIGDAAEPTVLWTSTIDHEPEIWDVAFDATIDPTWDGTGDPTVEVTIANTGEQPWEMVFATTDPMSDCVVMTAAPAPGETTTTTCELAAEHLHPGVTMALSAMLPDWSFAERSVPLQLDLAGRVVGAAHVGSTELQGVGVAAVQTAGGAFDAACPMHVENLDCPTGWPVTVASTTTGTDGTYVLPSLLPGTWQLTFTAPAGYVFADGEDTHVVEDVEVAAFAEHFDADAEVDVTLRRVAVPTPPDTTPGSLAPVPVPGTTQLPAPGSGGGQVAVGGANAEVTVTPDGSGGVAVRGGDVEMLVRPTSDETDGSAGSVDGTAMRVPSSGGVAVSGAGFRPRTTVAVWLFSEPTLLGEVEVAADGRIEAALSVLPANLRACDHTLQLVGTRADGQPVALSLGLEVVPDPFPFGDVDPTAPEAAQLGCAHDRGIVLGTAAGHLDASTPITRAQFAALVTRQWRLTSGGGRSARLEDVAGVHHDAIRAVVDAGMMAGFGDDRFGPALVLTRAQLHRVLGGPAPAWPESGQPVTRAEAVAFLLASSVDRATSQR